MKALFLLVVLLGVVVLSAAQNISITEYPIPTANSSPNGITAGPDGAIWFTESATLGGFSRIGRVTTSGVFTEYLLPSGCPPELITAGPDGALWFTESYCNRIGRITTTGVIQEYLLPHSSQLAESYPVGIVSGPDDALWFTELFGNRIGRITTSGFITEYDLPQTNSGPNGITIGSDGNLWFTESAANKIGFITTAGAITEYALPVSGYPIRIAAGRDGRLWFLNEFGNSVGAITTGGAVSEYPIRMPPPPLGSLSLHGIAAGPDGALWFIEAATNFVGRITTAGLVTEYAVPTPNSGPLEITSGPDGALWFTEGSPMANKIGKIVLPDTTPPKITVSASPNTLWPPNGKMVPVLVRGTVSDTGSGVLEGSVAYAVIDEYHRVQPTGHLALNSAGKYAFRVLLQASRYGNDANGRQYMIQLNASDNAGNLAVKSIPVTVPHNP